MKITSFSGGCLTLLLLFLCSNSKAQALRYDYDAAGNRILKERLNSDGEEEHEPGEFRKKVTEITQLDSNHFSLFPNPLVGSKLQVNFYQEPKIGTQLDLYSSQGILLHKWTGLRQKNQLDFASHSSGIYYLVFQSNEKQITKRIVKP